MLPGIYMDIDFYAKVDEELAKIPYCSPKCNYYMACPVCDRSDTNAAPCVLLMLEESQRRRFVNLYLRGRDGLKAEATELLFNLARKLDLKQNPGDMITYIDTILKIDRSFKVDTTKVKETPKIEQEEAPARVEVTVTKKAKSKDPDEKIVRKLERELDDNPESLFNSPVVDETKAKLKIGDFKLPNEKKVISVTVDGICGALEGSEFEP